MNAREQARFDMVKTCRNFRNQERLGFTRPAAPIVTCLMKHAAFILLLLFGGGLEGFAQDRPIYYVVGVEEGDTLNVRSSPSERSSVVARLRNDTSGIRITGKTVMNGTDDWVPIVASGIKGWVRPKFLSPNRDQLTTSKSVPTRSGLIGELLIDCQNQLIPVVNLIENGRALRALGELCPDSTPSQRATVRRALHLMVNDEFLSAVKEKGVTSMAPGIKAIAVSRDPTLLESPCLLDVIDETVLQLFTHPFGF